MRGNAEKPLLGFGWAGAVLLVVLLALAVPTIVGVDLRYQLQRAVHACFGWSGTVWLTTVGLWCHRLSLERPGFSTVSLLYVLLALHVHPRRVRWWWYAALIAVALAAPVVELHRALRFWPPPWSFIIWSTASSAAAGLCLAGAVGSWKPLPWIGVGVAAGALMKWSVETRAALATPEMMAWFCAWHVMWAVPLLAWAMAARVRRRPPYACPECGYDMRGASAARCPECGAAPGSEMIDA
jgi:hypothetical protein